MCLRAPEKSKTSYNLINDKKDVIRIGIHQPNFIPYFPFFYKMASVDVFIILSYCNFEKNNYQNRYLLNGKDKWVTKSVSKEGRRIVDKIYKDGSHLLPLNMAWINVIKRTLNINTRIEFDYPTEYCKTERLIDLIKHYGGNTYVTCPEAKDKYLNEELMKAHGINIEYYNPPKNVRKHIFEMFEEFGIDGTIKQLPKKCKT